jgi:hypothetical protein
MSGSVQFPITGVQYPSRNDNGFYLVGKPFTAHAITPPASPISTPPGSPRPGRWVATPVTSQNPSERNARFEATMLTGAGMKRLMTAEQWRALQRGPNGAGR